MLWSLLSASDAVRRPSRRVWNSSADGFRTRGIAMKTAIHQVIRVERRSQEVAPARPAIKPVSPEHVERLQGSGVERAAHGHEEALLQDGRQTGVVVEPLRPEQALKGRNLGDFATNVTQNRAKRLGQHQSLASTHRSLNRIGHPLST
ncbi:hypothetical protein PG993_003122 [Apiospora rasikravindrae]|uniref:Uncharacterized protein n=1 Tax=Apiospora rasikravindrae TaxID=990691 RepID=A0ABR1TYP1_9PEZI